MLWGNAMNLFSLQEMAMNGSDEVYTPPCLFDRMGLRFEIDVCAPPGGLPWIPADRHFSISDDGLSQKWAGRVWCNPPYSNATPWIRKFIGHRNGIILIPMCRSRAFVELWDSADAVCVPSAFNITADPCHFLKDNRKKLIGYAVALAGFGADCVEALKKLGQTRWNQKHSEDQRLRIFHLEYDQACSDGWECEPRYGESK